MTLEELKTLAEAATPRPWKLWGMTVMDDPKGTSNVEDCREIATTFDPDRGLRTYNANYIIAACNAVPKLLEMIACYEKAFATADASQIARAREIERSL